VHPDLATPAALGATDVNGAALAVEIALSQCERFADP